MIAPQWVVTAAHCGVDIRTSDLPNYQPEQYTLLAKTHTAKVEGAEVLRVDRVIVNPKWDRTMHSLSNDVALLHLSTPTTAPAMRVATQTGVNAKSYFTIDGVPNLAGWGLTIDNDNDSAPDELQDVYSKLWNDSDCTRQDKAGPPVFDPATMICAGTPGHTSCHGDSGGPLVVFMNDNGVRVPVLYGIVSWGDKCGENITYQSRVSAFGDFLSQAITLDVPPPPPPVATPAPTTPAPAIPATPQRDLLPPHLSAFRIPGIIHITRGGARRNIAMRMRSDDGATLIITLFKRGAGGRLTRVHGTYRQTLRRGHNLVVLPRKAWRLSRSSPW